MVAVNAKARTRKARRVDRIARLEAAMREVTEQQRQVADGLFRLQQTVQCKVAAPAQVLDIHQAANRIGKSPRTLEKIAAKGVFTDGRPHDKRRGSKRLFLGDEIDIYRAEGAQGVERLRKELARA
jgi:hypothetical protein